MRQRQREKSWKIGAYKTTYTCKAVSVINADAYTAGDYRIFFNDPRTRADYLEWAPLLLAAEDYAHNKVPLSERPDPDAEYDVYGDVNIKIKNDEDNDAENEEA